MAWYDSAWLRRVKLTVQNTDIDSDLTDFPIYLDLSRLSSTFWDNVLSDGGDIRVTTSDEVTEVPVEVQIDTSAETGFIYFKGDPLSASTTDFYLYFYNPSATLPAASDTYGSENVWKTAFKGVWHLEEDPSGSAPQVIDSTLNDNDGTSSGSMTTGDLISAQVLNGLNFDGSDDYISIPDAASLDITTDISISFWFRESGSSAGWTTLVGKRDNNESVDANYIVNFNPDGGTDLFQIAFYNGGFQTHTVGWAANFGSATWYHITATFTTSGSDVITEIFKNGVSISTKTHTSQSLNANNSTLNFAATKYPAISELFNGDLDEVRIAAELHSDAWIKAQHSAENDNASFITLGAVTAGTKTELENVYTSDANVHRVKLVAQASELSGTGTINATGWLINQSVLPAALIDSDNSASEASGAPTLRASTDLAGTNQIALEIVDFTPASGGAGGGATAEIWLSPGTYVGATDKNVYLWWITGGSQTQPAVGDAFGRNAVWSAYEAAFNAKTDPTGSASDVPDSSGNHDGSSAGSMAALTAGPSEIQNEWVFDGTNDEITFGAFDVPDSITFEFWANIPNTSTQYAIVGKHTGAGGNEVVLIFESGGGLASIINAGLQISGSSVTGDHLWYVTIEASGADTIVKWYKDGILQVTQTHSSQLIGDTSGGNEWVWGQEWDGGSKSDFFASSMAAMRFLTSVDTNASDVASTKYNNQSDQSTFWSTSAVEDGPLSAATPSYEWTFSGRTRTWTGKILKSGFEGTTTTVCAGSEMRITWGDRTNTFDDRIRAAEMHFELFDPDLTVYNDLISGEEGDFTAQFTDSTGTYTINMLIRLDEVSTQFVDDIEQHITSIYAYCGMAELQNVDAVTLISSTFHNIFRLMLVSNAIAQDIEYYSTHYAENVAGTGALLSLMRLNRLDLIFAEEGRKVDSMYDQLRALLEALGLFTMDGMDGRWHVKHEYGLGETVTDRGGQYFDYSSGSFTTLATLTGKSITLVNRTIGRHTMKRPLKPVQAVQVSRGNPRDFFTVDIIKHGDFENGWTSSTAHEVWTTLAGTYARSTNSDTGTYAFKTDSGGIQVQQDLLNFAGGGQNLDIEVAFRYAIESDNASTTPVGSSTIIPFYLNPNTLDVNRGDGGGTWDPLSGAISIDNSTIVANGSALTWTTLITTVYGPLPDFDGILRVRVEELATNYSLYLDTLEVRLKKADKATMEFRAVSGRYDLNGNLIGTGGVVEQEVPFYNGLLGTDVLEDGTRDEAIPMIQVLTTPAGSWVQASDFKTFTVGYTTEEYADSFELTATLRIAQQNQVTESIEGEYAGIAPHDYLLKYGANSYIQTFTGIDLRREITEFVAHRKLLGASVDFTPTTIYWGDADNNIKKATIQEPGSGVWTNQSVATLSSTILHLRVDEQSGYWFVLHLLGSGAQTITRYDIDGSNPTTIINDTGTKIRNFDIGRIGKRVLVSWDDNAGTGNNYLREYDYDGNLTRVLKTQAGIIKFQWCCYDPSEANVYFFEYDNAPLVDDTKCLSISDLSETTLMTSLSLTVSGEVNTGRVDSSENKLWIFGPKSGANRAIIEIDLPSGGSESDYKATTDGLANEGFAMDRSRQRLAYSKGGGDIYWDNYAGTDEEQIIEGGVSAPVIESIDFGYN